MYTYIYIHTHIICILPHISLTSTVGAESRATKCFTAPAVKKIVHIHFHFHIHHSYSYSNKLFTFIFVLMFSSCLYSNEYAGIPTKCFAAHSVERSIRIQFHCHICFTHSYSQTFIFR